MKLYLSSLWLLLFLLLFFFAFPDITAHKDNIVQETCKRCAQNDRNLDYNFCVTSLQAVPESHRSNLHQLGMISIKLTRHNVTNTKSYIKELLKNKKLDLFIRACLNDCFDLYSDAVATLRQAMKDYKAKRYVDANIRLSSVLDASTTCEDGFKEKEDAVSPLTKRNNNTVQLSAVALSIMNMVS